MVRFKIVTMVLAGLLFFCGTSVSFTTHHTDFFRSFEKLEAVVGGMIRVTITFSNLETENLRGVYMVEHIPLGLSVTTVSVRANDEPVTDFIYESGAAGEVYAGTVPHRWVFEIPNAFLENNPLLSSESVEVVYEVSAAASGNFEINEFNWVGYYYGFSDGAFGHSEAIDVTVLTFHEQFNPPDDTNPDDDIGPGDEDDGPNIPESNSGSGGGGGGCFVASMH